jgi:hypothetical protein
MPIADNGWKYIMPRSDRFRPASADDPRETKGGEYAVVGPLSTPTGLAMVFDRDWRPTLAGAIEHRITAWSVMPADVIAGQSPLGKSVNAKVPVAANFDTSGQAFFDSLSERSDVSDQVVQLMRAEVPLKTDNLGVHLNQFFL